MPAREIWAGIFASGPLAPDASDLVIRSSHARPGDSSGGHLRVWLRRDAVDWGQNSLAARRAYWHRYDISDTQIAQRLDRFRVRPRAHSVHAGTDCEISYWPVVLWIDVSCLRRGGYSPCQLARTPTPEPLVRARSPQDGGLGISLAQCPGSGSLSCLPTCRTSLAKTTFTSRPQSRRTVRSPAACSPIAREY